MSRSEFKTRQSTLHAVREVALACRQPGNRAVNTERFSFAKPVAADSKDRHPGRMTSIQAKPLLIPVSADSSWRDIAVIGGHWEDDGALAAGFFEAADILVTNWKAHYRSNDRLVLPILANYRHGIELALKNGIRNAARCARRDGAADPDLDLAKLNTDLAMTHSLGDLVQKLIALLGRLRLGEGQQLPADTLEVLHSMNELDASGQTFRYATVKIGQGKARKLVAARPDQVHLDLPAVADLLDDVAGILLHGVSGVLQQYEEFQDDMFEQMADNSSY